MLIIIKDKLLWRVVVKIIILDYLFDEDKSSGRINDDVLLPNLGINLEIT